MVWYVVYFCNKWGECFDDWYKMGENNCFVVMFFIKLMGFVEIIVMENFWIGIIE